MILSGGCLCGAVRYQSTSRPVWSHNCHCTRCRRARGAAFASNLFVPLDSFCFLEGRDSLSTYRLPGGGRFAHVFCQRCGASQPYENEARGLAVIPMGSLDEGWRKGPRANIFVDSKAEWYEIEDSLSRFGEGPGNLEELDTEDAT